MKATSREQGVMSAREGVSDAQLHRWHVAMEEVEGRLPIGMTPKLRWARPGQMQSAFFSRGRSHRSAYEILRMD